MAPGRAPEAGVTLIEMLVALALFALIGLAGFTVLSSILAVQRGTEGRLARIAALDRGLTLLGRDIAQARTATLRGQTSGLRFDAPGLVTLRYGALGGDLIRSVDRADGAGPVDQRILEGIGGAEWRYLGRDWVEDWPSPGQGPLRAVGVTLRLREGEVTRLWETSDR